MPETVVHVIESTGELVAVDVVRDSAGRARRRV